MLRSYSVPVWYSETNIRGAQIWHDEIGVALKRCDWMVLILSPDAVSSKWVKRELVFSLQEDRLDGRIVPILYRCCEHEQLSWTLSQLRMIDFRFDYDKGCRELLKTWGLGFSPSDKS